MRDPGDLHRSRPTKPGKQPYKRKRSGTRSPCRSRRTEWYLQRETNNSRDRKRRTESGSGKGVRERIEPGYVEMDEKGA